MKQNITAVLLSGGTASRFWPLLDKNTFVFQGKEFLYWHYLQLIRTGIDTCIVVTNESTNNSIRSITVPEELRVSYAIQKGQGMGQAVAALDGKLFEEPIIILNASDYYSDSFMTSFTQKITKEEAGKMGSWLIPISKYKPTLILNVDGGKSVGTIDVKALGQVVFEIEVIGKAAHASLNPEKGIHAIKIAAEIITKINIGRRAGGDVVNIGFILQLSPRLTISLNWQ